MSETVHDDRHDLDRELAALVATDPSPAFQARIRTRIARAPMRAASWWRRPVWQAAATAATVAALLVATWTPRESSPPAARTEGRPSRPVSPSTAAATPPARETTAVSAAAAGPIVTPSAREGRAGRETPVAAVSPAESRGFSMLVRRLDDGTIDAGSGVAVPFLAEAADAAADPIHIQAIEIAAIEIAPIVMAAAGETE